MTIMPKIDGRGDGGVAPVVIVVGRVFLLLRDGDKSGPCLLEDVGAKVVFLLLNGLTNCPIESPCLILKRKGYPNYQISISKLV